MMMWLLLCPAILMVASGEFGVETKYDELNMSLQGRMDKDLDNAANEGKRNWINGGSHSDSDSFHSGFNSHHSSEPESWSDISGSDHSSESHVSSHSSNHDSSDSSDSHHGPPHHNSHESGSHSSSGSSHHNSHHSDSYDSSHHDSSHHDSSDSHHGGHHGGHHKCKFNVYKYKHHLEEMKEKNGVCNGFVGVQANKLSQCESDYEVKEQKEAELKAALDKATGELKALKTNLIKIKSNLASSESSQDKILLQLADLREAKALITANNRILIRDLEECDENEEHCSENLEECNFRCTSSSSDSSRMLD